ncbi:hydrolase 1, exosortase A system-associated [Massilia violaceinigra]|uniref:Hydrolase 1, exosortase A system-associated n=1 Tax=Massilia violaceinigra TaxID=2045208 RepID=A0A2D2DQ54_9BURK|nr:hydrolase 1, exosortase A system-associated [Massilia violaceinigra]ATQ77112.1 hydrolase 1, exosortase A system-associated [Massilia violaceinigra]
MMEATQRALQFNCGGSSLVGILDLPERPLSRGVLVVTSAPQYRIGNHRHFTLLARLLAARGIPVMRFDHRGMGDSEGEARTIDALGEDTQAAMRAFFAQMPGMQDVVLWGLGDAATAAVLYAQADARVSGVVLLNPWMHTPGSAPRADGLPQLLARLGELDFWKRVASDSGDGQASVAARRQNMRAAAADASLPLPQRVLASLSGFDGAALVILGGDEPGAQHVDALLKRHEVRCKCVTIAGADRTFASRAWRDAVAEVSANWIASW